MLHSLTRPCSYFMAVAFALSNSTPLDQQTTAQQQLNINTQDLVKFFRVDRVSKSVSDIMGMFVHMLEELTCTREGRPLPPPIQPPPPPPHLKCCVTTADLRRSQRRSRTGTRISAASCNQAYPISTSCSV